MTEIPGADYAWRHPGGAALQKAGVRFVCRYSSTDPDKDLTRAEADDLAAHGIWSVIVRESTAKRASQGRPAGITDAQAAIRTGNACGMPSSRPLYFAVDYDADPADVVAYFQGVASVIGLARTGVYGGYKVVKYLLDHGYVKWAWQTGAWSGNRWDPRANIRQLIATRRIGGVDCDVNTAYTTDYGQWQPGKPPNLQEPDVELTDKITIKGKGNPYNPEDQTASVGDWIAYGNQKAGAALEAADKANAKLDALTKQVATLEKGTPVALTPETATQIATALATNPAFVTAFATAVVDLEAKRLQS